MSIIRATRQKGGSTFPLTSHVSLFFIRSSFGTHLAYGQVFACRFFYAP